MNFEQWAIWGSLSYLVMMISYSSYRSWKISAWPYVTGKLLDAEVETLERGSAYENVTYEYEVDGEKYVGNRLSPLKVRGQVRPRIKKQLAKIQYVSKDQVKVFYDVRNPRKSYLIKETWLNIIFNR